MAGHAQQLQGTTPAQLTRFSDRVSFVYLDRAKVVRDDTGVIAYTASDGEPVRVPIPAAAIACVLLGPGTSITSPALETLCRCGAVVLSVGSEATRSHSWSTAGSATARWAEAHARLWADQETRIDVAKRMYLKRFAEVPPGPHTLERLRGFEGARMKLLYRSLAAKQKIPEWRRRYDPASFDTGDPVNQALSTANSCLYGVCLAAIVSIGAIPQLGFVHAGNQLSFVHDIADLYKHETSIPAAFLLARSDEPAAAARRAMRRQFREKRLLARIVDDVQDLLRHEPEASVDDISPNRLRSEEGTVAGGVNWHRIVGDTTPVAQDLQALEEHENGWQGQMSESDE